MRDVESYSAVFTTGHYSDALLNDIHGNQQQLGGRTFFERLLELLHIKVRRIYPPKDEATLRDLHKRIIDAPITLHYKHCLLFYLLKDLSSPAHSSSTHLGTKFASDVHLEKRFWTFIEGIWELDHLQFETAVGNLTHPSIIPTFPDEILLTLLSRRRGASERDVLPLAYFQCTGPPLVNEQARLEWVRYLAARNVTEAFYWIRTRPEHERKALMEAFLDQTLTGRSWGNDDGSSEDIYPKEEKAMELVGLAFNDEEEEWIRHHLTEGKGRTLRGAEDTVRMRLLATGRLKDFATEGRSRGHKVGGVDWQGLRDGVVRGLGPRKDEQEFRI